PAGAAADPPGGSQDDAHAHAGGEGAAGRGRLRSGLRRTPAQADAPAARARPAGARGAPGRVPRRRRGAARRAGRRPALRPPGARGVLMAHRRRDDGGRGQAPQARCLPAAALGAAVLLGLTACAAGPNGGVRHADGAAQEATMDEADRWAEARERMVRTQIEARGVRDPRVLDAMRTVPRHEFVAEGYEARAYD